MCIGPQSTVHRIQDPGDAAGRSDDVVLPHVRAHTQTQSHLHSSLAL